MPQKHRWLVVLIGSLVGAIGLVAIYIGYLLISAPTVSTPSTVILTPDSAYNGITRIDPPLELPDFTLTNQDNEPINLSDLTGKLTLITFGFTHCPDVCPITLGEIRTIHAGLDTQADDINFVFISVDGERDTPNVLRDYFELLSVNDFVVGMTGTPDIVREIGTDYGVEFIYNPADEQGNYSVDHTAGMFLLDAEGNWIRRYAYATAAPLLIDDIEAVLASDT